MLSRTSFPWLLSYASLMLAVVSPAYAQSPCYRVWGDCSMATGWNCAVECGCYTNVYYWATSDCTSNTCVETQYVRQGSLSTGGGCFDNICEISVDRECVNP